MVGLQIRTAIALRHLDHDPTYRLRLCGGEKYVRSSKDLSLQYIVNKKLLLTVC